MNNSLILTVIDLIGKRKTENLIEKGFFNKSTELNEKEILECIERYKEIDSTFKVPSLDKIKATMENSEQILLKSRELGIKCISIFNDNFPDKLKNIKGKFLVTINDHPKVREWYKDFNIKEVEVHYSVSRQSEGRKRNKELIITNY